MSGFDIEISKQNEAELRKVFKGLFPLVPDSDLPWAACHIPDFLRARIKEEVERATANFVSRIARILCEVSPPKTHMEDMARIVVEKAKSAGVLAREKDRRVYYQDIVYDVCNVLDRQRSDGQKTICGTLETPSKNVQETLALLFIPKSTVRHRTKDN